ncbi:peptidyl-tRNA hydrolase 2, mitochondrial-like [Sitophilus oryzae]|uniref:peptidyl-tRNA hydrolase n=1 Tax=Sitophilus oryzae TaxID=7048 RepID=A0A6J2X2B5_SITOR|nr:peptidyl-tRNA hydrolase 2, mitochondrial-like [Sitophilus oryzae]XP_030745069.1 peptidyl-tRNA hydrolase 2, mitochondrial-like [Sitophilus oryzae]
MGQRIGTFLVNMWFSKPIKSIGFCQTKMVFLVRTDLGMGKGKIASQVAHAAIELYKQSLKNGNPYLKPWLNSGQPKIVLKISNNCEKALEDLYNSAKQQNLTVTKIQDSGKTQIEYGSLTVVAVGPGKVKDIDKITSQYKLL